MRARALTLRLKLALWYLVVFAGLQLAILTAVVLLRRDAIQRWNDDRLVEAAEELASVLVADGLPRESPDPEGRLAPPGDVVFVAVRNLDRDLVWASGLHDGKAPPYNLTPRAETGLVGPVLEAVDAGQAARFTGEASPLRQVTLPFRTADRHLLFLQTARRIRSWRGSAGSTPS